MQKAVYISNFTAAVLTVTFDLLKTERFSPIQVLSPWVCKFGRKHTQLQGIGHVSQNNVTMNRKGVSESLYQSKTQELGFLDLKKFRFLDLKSLFVFCDAWEMHVIDLCPSEESRHLLKFSWNKCAEESLMGFT